MLRIHNSISRSKEDFVPQVAGHVRMYVCGITVYDFCHIGHARMFVVFDVVQRWLRASGYQVTYVRNITDIDDKIIRRAVQAGETIGALTERFIGAMHEDTDALGVQRPDHEPRATQYVPRMLSMIGTLQEKGFAYRADGGDVNFAVRRFEGYGRLSGKSIDELRAGERVAVAGGKQDPLDFVLWKAAKPDEPAEATWASAFGPGRPGWHIECSAMSGELLGPSFDIHGGGADLQFPHHENEIAQSEAANGCRFVNYWMHNGFVRVDDEKMSKSLGNFFTIREVLQRFDAEVVRFFILRAHYRSPLNYSDAHLEDARAALMRLYTALPDSADRGETPTAAAAAIVVDAAAAAVHGAAPGPASPAPRVDRASPWGARFADAMDDDFNTPVAVSVLFELAADLNRARAEGDAPRVAMLDTELRGLAAVLGLLEQDPARARRNGLRGQGDSSDALDENRISRMVAERSAAKKARDFARADALRAELSAAGVVLEDGPGGTTWRRA